jgi:nucleotide-binding universal stress UspA family protein
MYTRILTPLDGSEIAEQVLPYVKIIAGPDRVPITLLRVIEPPPYGVIATSQGVGPDDENIARESAAREYLDKAAGPLREQGFSVSLMVRAGAAATRIVEEASAEPGALIAMSTHGRSGVARWAFGSVTDKVIQTAANPLLIVRSSDDPPAASDIAIQSIMAPLDGSSLAEQVLPHVVHLAKSLNLGVILLRATPAAADYYRFMDYPVAQYDDLPEQVDAEALGYLEEQGRQLRSQGLAQVQERLVHGPAAIAVADFARETPNSLVAMTTHGRSGLGRWILGSVADRVIRHSGGPVLVIRATEETS